MKPIKYKYFSKATSGERISRKTKKRVFGKKLNGNKFRKLMKYFEGIEYKYKSRKLNNELLTD